jgi:hypothetical protein
MQNGHAGADALQYQDIWPNMTVGQIWPILIGSFDV